MKVETVERIENLISSIEKVSQSKNKVEVCEEIEALLKELTDSDFASLFLFDKEKKLLYTKKEQNFQLSMIDPRGCIGRVFLTKTPAIYNHIASDKDYVQAYDNPYNHKLRAQMLMPVLNKGELVGIVRVSRAIGAHNKSYTKTDLETLMSIESYLIKMIRNILSNEQSSFCNEPTENIQTKIKKVESESRVEKKDDDMLLFFSNTVHDIRTPANTLYGFLELLEEQIEDERLKEFVINAKKSASFINTLTTTILDAAKSKYISSTHTNMETITTVKYLAEIANGFAAKMLEKKIHYFIYISPEIPKEVKLDALKLKRILTNLIGNAYKFTPIKREIFVNIRWDASEDKIKFSVKDKGIGIEESAQKKLFKAFSQAQDDTHEKYGGTGLGLAISAGYVAQMGGELKLKSEVDKGSEFYFDIPVEVIDRTRSYDKFYNLDKKIVILTDFVDAKYPKFVRNYLVDLGMPKEKIVISNKLKKHTTHVICFEEKITPEILESGKSKAFELLLVENHLFSLLKNKEIEGIEVTSKNTYNGEALHTTVFSGKKVKVLIVDDNKINISLLESMLSTEFVEMHTALSGDEGLEMLKQAAQNGERFDVVYLDEHMPGMSGLELLHTFRAYEQEHHLPPICAASISGDPYLTKEEEAIFDLFVNKPFSKDEVRNVIEFVKS